MKATIDLKVVKLHGSQQIEGAIDGFRLEIGTSNMFGRRSHEIQLSLTNNFIEAMHNDWDGIRQPEPPNFYFILNKNQALYLKKSLEAFIEEQDIDIDAED